MNFWTHEIRTARKPHRCDHCWATIPSGVKYSRGFGVEDGNAYSWPAHLDCSDLAGELWREYGLDYDEGIDLSDEWCDARDEMREWRGKYPHVICRFEFHEQMRQIKNGDWEGV